MDMREQLLHELPRLLREDPAVRQAVLDLVWPYFAERKETESRFETLLEELRRMREEDRRRWEAWERRWQQHLEEERQRWEAWERRWQQHIIQWEQHLAQWEQHLEEERQRWEAWERRWQQHMIQWEQHLEEERQRWEAWERRWQQHLEEERQRWEAWERRWQQHLEEYRKTIQRFQLNIRALDQRIRTVLGSIGARWGRRTEGTFRNAILGILKEYVPDVQVERILFQDERGEVFGYPADIELDLFIHNGRRLLGEIKSSMSRADVYAFVRKVRLYESMTGVKADRLIVISPMVEPQALDLAARFGVWVYTFPDEAQEAF